MLKRLDSLLASLEETLIALLIASASLILFCNVVARYVFNTGVVWAEELVRYEIIWLVFIGGSVAARKGIHIGVDVILHVLPRRGAQAVRVVVAALCVVFCLALAWYGFDLVSLTRRFGQKTPAMQMPFWIVQLAIPVGATLMALRFAQRLWAELAGRRAAAETEMLS